MFLLYIKKCVFCGKDFETKDKRKKFCDRKCYSRYQSNTKRSKIKVNCKRCFKELERYPSECRSDIFCSRECFKLYLKQNNSITFNCEICGIKKTISKSDYDQSKHHYCSYKCSKKGYSYNYRGEKNPNYIDINYKCDYCNKIFHMKKSEYKTHNNHFCSKKCKDKWQGENVRGINHPNFNPNITEKQRFEKREYSEYWDFRKKVYERDSYTCQCCGDNKGGNLNAHHIENYSDNEKKRTDINNGITLCDKCHKKFHKIYGNKNNNIIQLNEFLRAQ